MLHARQGGLVSQPASIRIPASFPCVSDDVGQMTFCLTLLICKVIISLPCKISLRGDVCQMPRPVLTHGRHLSLTVVTIFPTLRSGTMSIHDWIPTVEGTAPITSSPLHEYLLNETVLSAGKGILHVYKMVLTHKSLLTHSFFFSSLFLKYSFKELKKIFYLCIFREGEAREKRRERNVNVWVASRTPPTGDLVCNPGMCPDWESNQRRFGLQASTQSTEPHQPGLKNFLKMQGVFVQCRAVVNWA